eukprot:c16009_g1_i1 orf=31-495(+)
MVVVGMGTAAMRGCVQLFLPAFAVAPAPSRYFNKSPLYFSSRCCSSSASACSSPYKFESSDVLQLAEKARITLTPTEVEDFRPKLEQLVGWFGQLQEVDLDDITPALRADNLSERQLREDVPSAFEDRDAIFAAVPEAEGPYIKVPKILNENLE